MSIKIYIFEYFTVFVKCRESFKKGVLNEGKIYNFFNHNFYSF